MIEDAVRTINSGNMEAKPALINAAGINYAAINRDGVRLSL